MKKLFRFRRYRNYIYYLRDHNLYAAPTLLSRIGVLIIFKVQFAYNKYKLGTPDIWFKVYRVFCFINNTFPVQLVPSAEFGRFATVCQGMFLSRLRKLITINGNYSFSFYFHLILFAKTRIINNIITSRTKSYQLLLVILYVLRYIGIGSFFLSTFDVRKRYKRSSFVHNRFSNAMIYFGFYVYNNKF